LGSYYAAIATILVGESEAALHAAFLLPAVAVVLGTYFLSRELNSPRPMLAALVALFTPVFLLCASTVMYDVIMLALWVWAVWAWAAGMRRERAGLLWLAAGLATLAALTKYFGVALLPLLLAYGLARRRR